MSSRRVLPGSQKSEARNLSKEARLDFAREEAQEEKKKSKVKPSTFCSARALFTAVRASHA